MRVDRFYHKEPNQLIYDQFAGTASFQLGTGLLLMLLQVVAHNLFSAQFPHVCVISLSNIAVAFPEYMNIWSQYGMVYEQILLSCRHFRNIHIGTCCTQTHLIS